jgi:hypothetical protein
MPTFTQIGTAVVVGSGGAADITFSAIPNTYTDLVIKFSTRDTFSAAYTNVITKINGVTTSQSNRTVLGLGTGTPSSFADTPLYSASSTGSTATASTFSNVEIYIPNYASTSTNKSISIDSVTETNATGAAASLVAGLYASNTAITSITLTPNSGTFVQHSTAYLYGVSNA